MITLRRVQTETVAEQSSNHHPPSVPRLQQVGDRRELTLQRAFDVDTDFDQWSGDAHEGTSTQVGWSVRADGSIEDLPLLPPLHVYSGQPIQRVEDWLGTVHELERERVTALWQHAQTEGRAFATVCRLRRHDGVYRDFSLHALPARSPQAGELIWIQSGIDITTRTQHQRKREAAQWRTRAHNQVAECARLQVRAQVSEARFRRLLEANNIGIVVLEDRQIVEANDCYLDFLGYSREDLVAGSMRLDDITAPDSRAVTENALHVALANGACMPFEKEYIRRDGSRVPALVVAVLVASNPPQFVTFVVDLTTQKRLERERNESRAHEMTAIEVSRNLDEFFATAAHDIRSPVTAVLGNVQLAEKYGAQLEAALRARGADEADAAARLLTTLATAQVNVDRLTRMTKVLFDVAQARAGSLDISPVPCDLLALVRGQVDALRSVTPDRSIELREPSTASVRVLADPDRLQEVLANYLSNALKYSDNGRAVTVRLDLAEQAVTVCVRDEGLGLPDDELEWVWEPFHRAPGVRAITGTGGSLGLGLHICKRIVELHPGGRVGAESEKGQGSTFWFRLPLLADATLTVPSGAPQP